MSYKLKDTWEFNVLGIYDYRKAFKCTQPTKLDYYYKYIIENHEHIEGDILEAGVFRGSSLLATALLLKELGSSKTVYGFDSFSGFPPIYHPNDSLEAFKTLFEEGRISKEHYDAHLKLKSYRSFIKNQDINVANISSSTNFSDTNREAIERKASFLGLDNIKIVEGDFSSTMKDDLIDDNLRLMAVLLDCDLYESYMKSLSFCWPKLSDNGYIFLDEYYSLKFPGARIACDEFFSNVDHLPVKHPHTDRDFERWFVTKNIR